jgi:arginyl-tRNA synthetase
VLDREKKYSFDKMIYVVTHEQESHFQRVFTTLEFMGRGDLAAKLQHVGFGKVHGMSEQLGKVHLLGDILNQTANAMHDILNDAEEHGAHVENSAASAQALGVSTLVTQDGLNRRATGYTFNTKKMASFEGETGPYLQVRYAKLCATIREADLTDDSFSTIDYTFLQEEPWSDVLRIIAQYPDITNTAFKSLEPSLLLGYLFRLMAELDNCVADDEDDGDEDDEDEAGPSGVDAPEEDPPEAMQAYGVLYACAKLVLDSVMDILGLTPVFR